MTTKAELQRQQESNEQLRLDCLAGFGVVLDHPICVKSQVLAGNLLMTDSTAEGFAGEIVNQLGRSLASVCANFAEGHGRSSQQDKIRFLRIARGSAYESVGHARIYYVEGAKEVEQVCELARLVDAYILDLLK